MSEIIGIHQSDLIIVSALRVALKDMRDNPWLLDFVFASLADDAVTVREYGQKRVAAARAWFLKSEIPVFMSLRLDEAKLPAISITLLDSNEVEHTLSDTHYQPQEDSDLTWPALTEPFTPTRYLTSTGAVTVNDIVADSLFIVPGQVLVDATGTQHPILDVSDRNNFSVAAGTVADFAGAVIKGKYPSQVATVESTVMKETYSIGCHVQGEAVFLSYLHSVVVFALLRYKETLLEGRGFERSTISSSDARRNESFDNEIVYSRHINITGNVRQAWPKIIAPKITGVAVTPLVMTSSDQAPVVALDPDLSKDDAWLAEQDGIGLPLK